MDALPDDELPNDKLPDDELPDEISPISRFTNSSEKIDRYEIEIQNQHRKQMSLWDELNSNDIEKFQDEYNEVEQKELQRQQEQEENEIRVSWNINDYVFIYSRSNDEWTDGKIIKIDGSNIKRNEWLHVRYGKTKNKTKKIQRNCADIKPIPDDHILSLNKGSKCLIYSNIIQLWCEGKVASVYRDKDGEWLRIKYWDTNEYKICDIQRFSKEIQIFKRHLLWTPMITRQTPIKPWMV
eukprot:151538_1